MHEDYKQPESPNYSETIHTMAAFFGISNLSIKLAPGSGWSCSQTNTGLEITVDPLQIARKESDDTNNDTGLITHRPEEILHTAAHEIGHARDILDGDMPTKLSPSDHFFWNAIHDGVIDTRLRHIPLLNAATDELYSQVLFPEPDLSKHPQHIQLMYGTLLSSVVPATNYTYSPVVTEALATLTNHTLASGQTANILQVLADLQTDMPSRVAIARQFIMPLYKQLLVEDQKNNKNDDGSSKDFSDEYSNTSSCSQPNPSQSGPQSSESDESSTGSDEQNDIAQEIAKQMQAAQNKSSQEPPQPANSDSESDSSGDGDTLKQLVELIKKDMELDTRQASNYADVIMKYQSVISRTADVFLQLSSYADTSAAHRYEPRAHLHGRRLHPTHLANAAIQFHTRHPESIWQPTDIHSVRQDLLFAGLDIHLVVDVSASMQSKEKSSYASACAAILLESLELAVKRAAIQASSQVPPDVRSQVIAFGASSKVLSPLACGTTPAEKGITYRNLNNPTSNDTRVNESLIQTQRAATISPGRDHIVIIITDGHFTDESMARHTVQSAPDNMTVAQLNIACNSSPITKNNIDVQSPHELPHYLLAILQEYLNKYEA